MPTKGGFFAERLKALRSEARLSQPELATKAGIGLSTLQQFEYGRREPTYGTLVKLAAGLGVSLAAFNHQGEAEPAPEKPKGRKGAK